MGKKLIQSGEKVGLKLSAAERKLILEGLLCRDDEYEDITRDTPTAEPVMMTLDEFDDFAGYIAAEANHSEDKKLQQKLDAIFQKIQRILETHRDEDNDKPLSIEQARGKITKAMNDLLAGKNPGAVSFRLKPTKKPGELYPLRTISAPNSPGREGTGSQRSPRFGVGRKDGAEGGPIGSRRSIRCFDKSPHV